MVLPALQGRAAAELAVEPGLTLSEEYNDNVFLAPQNPKTDYITRILPSIHMVYTAPIWEWDFAYAYDLRYYANRTRTNDSTHFLALTNHTGKIRDFLYLDVKDVYRRVSLDTTRDYTEQSLFFNQTDVNEFSLSPYARFKLSSHTTGTAGYQYRNLWYRERGSVDKDEHTVFGEFVNELSLRTSITAGARLARVDSDLLTYNKADVYAGPRFEYTDGSFLWVRLGSTWLDSNQRESTTQGYWDAGIQHRFRTYTLSFLAALVYIDDPRRVQRREDRYAALFQKETERTAITAQAARSEYRDIFNKHLETTSHSIGGTVGYRFTEALRTTYRLHIQRDEDNRMRTYSMLYLNALRGEYLFPANTTIALEYRFQHGYSPDAVNYELNHDNNRAVLEIRKLF